MRSRVDRRKFEKKRKLKERLLYKNHSHALCPILLKNSSVRKAYSAYIKAYRAGYPDSELYKAYLKEHEKVYDMLENCHFTRRDKMSTKDFKKITSGKVRTAERNLSEETELPNNGNKDRKGDLDWAWTLD
jgi:hypothetical protein